MRRSLGHVYDAPTDVVLSEADPAVVVQPYVLFVAPRGRATLTAQGVSGPPDLVVEVLSPGNASLDAIKKRELYGKFGVQEYWMVLPELLQIEVLRRSHDGGFELPLADLFEPED